MTHKWKIGDWAELRSNRYLVYRVVENGTAWAITECGGFNEIMFDANDKEVKKLEGCDSWTWQPPKPIELPEGYRLLDLVEVVKEGDKYLDAVSPSWQNVRTSIGRTVDENRPEHPGIKAYARKIEPKYRPFKNAAEFFPNKGRWVYLLGDVGDQLLIYSFDDRGIWHAGRKTSWEAMFRQAKFEDGEPFGVKE